MTRNNVYVGDTRVIRRYIGDNLIFDDLLDKTEILSGTEIWTDKADEDAVAHVEVDGKSYQEGVPSPDSPIEIHSLNDFDVVSSVGRRNLIKNGDFRDGLDEWRTNASGYATLEDGYLRVNSGRSSAGPYQNISGIEVGDTVTISALIRGSGTIRLGLRLSGHTTIEIPSEWEKVSSTITRTGDSISVTFYTESPDSYFDITDIKVEFGTKATPYTPNYEDITENDNHPLIDKINLLLDEPLRSVGDVCDRLMNKNGIWVIERNIELLHPEDGTRSIEETFGVRSNPLYENLLQEYQDKLNNLRSFKESNYVYTLLPDKSNILSGNLKPTLHATFKSIGWETFRKKVTKEE